MSNTNFPSDPDMFVEMFDQISNSTCQGISGVLKIDTGKEGPVVGITASTHGNEPAGLAAFARLLKEEDVERTLLKGVLYLVVNNLEATETYLRGDKLARFHDVNMNRLPHDLLVRTADQRSEVKRALELLPIWAQFTHGLDIHSTRADILPMIIGKGSSFHSDIIQGMPISTLIANIDAVQIGKPAFAFYGSTTDTKVLGVEAGTHEKRETFERAYHVARVFLENLGMLPKQLERKKRQYAEYDIYGSVLFPNMSYRFSPDLNDFETITQGTVIATGDGDPMLMPLEGCLIMKNNPRNASELTEEVSFLSRPAIHREL